MDGLALLCRKQDAEVEPLTSVETIKPNPVRWYILLFCATTTSLSNLIYMTYSPISISLQYIFNWDSSLFGIFELYETVGMFVFFLPSLWFMNKFGLKIYMLIFAFSNLFCAALRCFSTSPFSALVIAHITQITRNIIGVGASFFPSLLTSIWFPASEWNFATSFCFSVMHLGNIIPFLIGPLVVPSPVDANYDKSLIAAAYYRWIYGIAGFSALLLLLGVLYFPRKPKWQPSHTSKLPRRTEVYQGTKTLFKSSAFWLASLRFALSDPNLALLMVLTLYLKTKGMSQDVTGKAVFIGGITQMLLEVILGKIGDKVGPKGIKAILIAVPCLFLIGCLWWLLIGQSVFATSAITGAFATGIVIATGQATVGLTMEQASQLFYPLSETTTSGWIIVIQCFFGALFALTLQFPNIGLGWIDWYNTIAAVIAIVCAFFLPSISRRLTVENESMNNVEI